MSKTREQQSSTNIKNRVRNGLKQLVPSLGNDDRVTIETESDHVEISNPLARAYLETVAGTKLTFSSVETYENRLQEFTEFLEERSTDLVDVDRTDIIEYVERCVDRGNRQSTIEGKLTTIKELYRFARLRTEYGDRLALDPIEIDTIDVSDYNTPPTIEREALTRSELRRLFDALDSYRNRLMAVVAAETAIRNSDLRNLRVADVDFDACTIHVRNPKNAKPYDVPISQELGIELKMWCEEYQAAYAGNQSSEYLFPSQNGEKIQTNSGLNQIIKSAAEQAGIQETIGIEEVPPAKKEKLNTEQERREWHRVTVHTLRHTCLTLMKKDGIPLQYRQLVANHSNPVTTQRYSHGKEEEFSTIRDQYDPPR